MHFIVTVYQVTLLNKCSLHIYRQTMPSNFNCKGVRNATYKYLFDIATFGAFIFPR